MTLDMSGWVTLRYSERASKVMSYGGMGNGAEFDQPVRLTADVFSH